MRAVSVQKMNDPTAVRGTIEVLDQDIVNLDPNPFEVKRITVPLDDCCLIYSWSNSALRTRTLIHKNFDTCTILGPKSQGSINGAELRPYAFFAAGHGANAEIIVESGYESVVWMVPPEVIATHLGLRGISEDFTIPEKHEIWHPDANVARELFELGAQIAEAAENTPDLFNENHGTRQGAQVEYMDALFATIESCDADAEVDSDKKQKSYSEIVRACEDYTLELDDRRPYLSELCATANVSERTLQYAFHDIMGMSPLTYLHRLRLHRARNELQESESGSTTVTDVAMNWGFWHFGEFSRAYKNCFGELPSKTLKDA
jgi:AraC family transcriptional regulator, ethanolamine operon transcriptional activator